MKTRVDIWAIALLATACGNVHSPFPNRAEDAGMGMEEEDRDDPKEPTVIARLSDVPAELPTSNLRAALVWTETRNSGANDEIVGSVSVTIGSDVAVKAQMPLVVKLPAHAPEPHGNLDITGFEQDVRLYTLPIAEVVLYEDGNKNGRLDLVKPGESGPGPDRPIALSSGVDRQGGATRTLIVNKRNPMSPFYNPLPMLASLVRFYEADNGVFAGDVTPRKAPFPDGLYTIKLSVQPNQAIAQRALLSGLGDGSGLVANEGSSPFARFDAAYLRHAFADVRGIVETDVTLFAVDPERKHWLARGCALHGTGTLRAATLPPPGAAVQCGAGRLVYSTTPGDYCGQVLSVDEAQWKELSSDPWPCDSRGLIAGTPYVASTQRLDSDFLQRAGTIAAIGDLVEFSPDWSCEEGIRYDFDGPPQMHLPSIAPEPGSQVKCHSATSLSYIPPRADKCNVKFGYDLSSESYDGLGLRNFVSWDLRDDPPEWWPCDADGQLKPDSGYVAPRKLSPTGCVTGGLSPTSSSPSVPVPVPQLFPPPPNSFIRCKSATQYTKIPALSDVCDGRVPVTQGINIFDGMPRSEDSQEPGPEWPCDANGQLIARPGLESYD